MSTLHVLATYFSCSYRDFQLANKRFLYNLCCEKSSESEKFSMACYLITEKWIPWHDSLSIYSSPINMNKYPWKIILYCTAAVLILLTTTKKKKKKSILVYALETIVQNLPGNVPVMNTFQVCILLGDAKFCLCLHTLHADQQALVTKQFNHTEDIASENHESI